VSAWVRTVEKYDLVFTTAEIHPNGAGPPTGSIEKFLEEKMAAERSYDAIVIGAGQGGKPLSMVLARGGLKTAVIEERYVGGTCVNYG
jgi:hypothetical protein